MTINEYTQYVLAGIITIGFSFLAIDVLAYAQNKIRSLHVINYSKKIQELENENAALKSELHRVKQCAGQNFRIIMEALQQDPLQSVRRAVLDGLKGCK